MSLARCRMHSMRHRGAAGGCLRRKKVQHAERIGILEARGTVAAVRHKLRALRAFGCKHLHLSDNLGNVLGFSKGRMCNFGLLACCRQLAALCLAGNVVVKHR